MAKMKLTRRGFAASLAVLAAGAGSSLAQPVKPPEINVTEVESLLAFTKARYGKHLSEEQLKEVGKRIAGILTSAQRMQRVKLTNADEPDVVYSADLP